MTKTALIIDDNKMNLETLSILLKKEGFYSITLDSPRHILDVLNEVEQVDIIFLDLEFPNQDGFQTISAIADDTRLQDVPIVAYSVHISELQEVRDAGFHSFIGKPLNPTAFPDQLRRILGGESVWEVGQ